MQAFNLVPRLFSSLATPAVKRPQYRMATCLLKVICTKRRWVEGVGREFSIDRLSNAYFYCFSISLFTNVFYKRQYKDEAKQSIFNRDTILPTLLSKGNDIQQNFNQDFKCLNPMQTGSFQVFWGWSGEGRNLPPVNISKTLRGMSITFHGLMVW